MTLEELQVQTQNNKQEGKLPRYNQLIQQDLPALLQLNIGNKELVVYNNGLATFSDFIGGKLRHTVYSIYNLTLCYEYSKHSLPPIKISDFPELLSYDACDILILCGQDRLDQNTFSRESNLERNFLKKAKGNKISFHEDFTNSLIDAMVADDERQKQYQKLHQALKFLTEKQREVIKLTFWENMTQDQIAEKLGISRASVQDRLDGAKKKLRKYMTR